MIGGALARQFLEQGWTVVGLTRNADRARQEDNSGIQWAEWDAKSAKGWLDAADGSELFVNLAGENVAGGIWTEAYKKRILDSRVNSGRAISEAVQQMKNRPRLLLQASAVGIYGMRGDEVLTEDAAAGDGFLADVVKAWEESVSSVESSGVTVNFLRIGVVLSEKGGMLAKITLPYKLFVGGPVGGGSQWLSWIHLADVLGVIDFLATHKTTRKIFNLSAPNPVTMGQFSSDFAASLNRPSWLPLPAFAVKLLFQEMGEATILASVRAIPENLSQEGYQFRFPQLTEALADLSEAL